MDKLNFQFDTNEIKRKYKTYDVFEYVDGKKDKRYIDVRSLVINDRPFNEYLAQLNSKCFTNRIFTLLNIFLTGFLISKII